MVLTDCLAKMVKEVSQVNLEQEVLLAPEYVFPIALLLCS